MRVSRSSFSGYGVVTLDCCCQFVIADEMRGYFPNAYGKDLHEFSSWVERAHRHDVVIGPELLLVVFERVDGGIRILLDGERLEPPGAVAARGRPPCPLCGGASTYLGAVAVECGTPSCRNFPRKAS